jgi:hypothetical protein
MFESWYPNESGASTRSSSSRTLPPPASFKVRLSPTVTQSPVWSRTALTGGMGPYQRRHSVGSDIARVP